jgi:hypothetical protein
MKKRKIFEKGTIEYDQEIERLRKAYNSFYDAVHGYIITECGGLLRIDQAVSRLRRDLIRQYPEDEKAIDALIKYFLGEDALDDIILQSEEKIKSDLIGKV